MTTRGTTLVEELDEAADIVDPGPVLGGHVTAHHRLAARLRARAALVTKLLNAFRVSETQTGSYSEAVAHVLSQLAGPHLGGTEGKR